MRKSERIAKLEPISYFSIGNKKKHSKMSDNEDLNNTIRDPLQQATHSPSQDSNTPTTSRDEQIPPGAIDVIMAQLQKMTIAMTSMGARMDQLQRRFDSGQVAAIPQQAANIGLAQLPVAPNLNLSSLSNMSGPSQSNENPQQGNPAPVAVNHQCRSASNEPIGRPHQLPPAGGSHINSSPVSSIPSQPMAGASLQQPIVMHQKPYELPEFDEQWPVFIAAFYQSTLAFGYTPLQNVFRLQKALKGEARETVEYLLINPNNIEGLIETLRFRFGRPEILAKSQMLKVRQIPEITEKRIDQLVPFSTRVTNLVAFLNTNASRHILSETTLLSELISKLPPTKRLEWIQHSIRI